MPRSYTNRTSLNPCAESLSRHSFMIATGGMDSERWLGTDKATSPPHSSARLSAHKDIGNIT